MNGEFQFHRLNEQGVEKAKAVAEDFDRLLEVLKTYVPVCREFSIVRTKLEEAFFFAKKAIAQTPAYQR